MRIFDTDGAPISYEHLGHLAPESPGEWEATGRLYAEIEIRDFPTTATTEHELIQDLVRAYHLRDADTLDFDLEEAS